MPARCPKARSLSASIAATERHNPHADTSELRRDLRAARLEDFIRVAVEAAPPFTDEQVAHLRALIAPAVAAVRDDLATPSTVDGAHAAP